MEGKLGLSAVRELSRVATPDTEAAWCAIPPDPRLHRRRVVLDLSRPERSTRGSSRCARPRCATGDHEVLDRPPAKYQIAISVCPACDEARQDGGGRAIPIDPAARERAECDPDQRATQTIPPAIRRFVWRRDHGKCRVPGCRSARNLEIHHIVRRADGGTHDPQALRRTSA